MIDLRLGDCLSILPSLEAGSVDCVVTDPPFSDVTHNGARTKPGTHIANSRNLIPYEPLTGEMFVELSRELLRIANRWVVMFCDWHHAALLEPSGLPLIRLGIWIKPNSAPQFTGDRPATGWEAVAILHRQGKKFWNGGGSRAVWEENRVDASSHPNEKPARLIVKMLKQFTDEGDVVFDPFMGSGTTGVACFRTRRNFLGIEIDPGYFAIAQKRIAAEQAKMSLFAGID